MVICDHVAFSQTRLCWGQTERLEELMVIELTYAMVDDYTPFPAFAPAIRHADMESLGRHSPHDQ
jgi:hypothetical protein